LDVYKDGEFFLRFTEADITVTGNSFTIDVTNLFPDNGNYYVLISDGLFSSDFGVYSGINDSTIWTFSIGLGQYNSEEYNNEQYLT
jgi:hypothetical protein